MSTVTIHGATMTLREGEIILGDDYLHEQRWYVGGQSERSHRAAAMLLESLLDDPVFCRVDPSWRPLGACASARFGNCLSVKVITLARYQQECAWREGKDWRCGCGCLNRAHEAFCFRCGGGQPE